MSMDALCCRCWRSIPKPQRWAFFSCLITGYLVHLYAFTNLIPNADGLSRVFDTQQMTISGRWFLHYASALNSFTQMPAAIGLLSLLFLSLAAALTVSLLQLHSRTLSALAGAVMAAFPVLSYLFLYLFTASAYCMAIFLAVLAVWLCVQGRKLSRTGSILSWLGSALCLAMSMGIYQAYVTVAIALAMLVVLQELLRRQADFSGTLRLGLRLIALLACGAVLYYGILQLMLSIKGLELLSYLGMDAAASGYPLRQLPWLLLDTYKQAAAFFFFPGSANGFASSFSVLLHAAACLSSIVLYIRYMHHNRLLTCLWRQAGTLCILLLFPLGLNFGQLLSPYSTPTPLMKYAFVCVYLLVLLLLDRNTRVIKSTVTSAFALLWSACLLLFFLNTSNIVYTASAQAHRATESYLTRLLCRIEDCPGYEAGMEVAVIGAIPPDALSAQIASYQQVAHYSVPTDSIIQLNKHIYYYFNDWLNVDIEEPEEAVMISVSNDPAFQSMPLYPAQGSIQILDGRVVVKLQQQYTPKSDYEIEYENRR